MQKALQLGSLALVGLLTTTQVVAQISDPTLPRRGAVAGPLLAPHLGQDVAARSTGPWLSLSSMTTARAQQGAVAHPNGNIYVFGGYNGVATFSSTEAYNIATGTWSSRASMPVAMQGPATALGLDGKIYSFAGRDMSIYRTECFAYDPATDTWAAIAPMPAARWQARALTAPSGLIYVFGGWNFDLGVTPGNEVQIYNPATNSWTLGAPIPVALMGMGAAIDAAGLMHLYGGIGENPYAPRTSHYIYNPATNSWTTGASLPAPARGYTSGVAGSDGNLYVAGGDSDIGMNAGTLYNDVDYYNPATNSWSAATSLPLALTELGLVAMGNSLYVLGGLLGPNTPSSTMYRMDLTPVAPVTSTTWTGAVSSAWNTAGNWTAGVPTTTVDANIPDSVATMPVISSGTAEAKALRIAGSASLALSGGELELTGDLDNAGSLMASGGKVRLTGNAAQTLAGTGSSTFYDLEVGGAGASLGGPVQVRRVLQLNGNLASAGRLTLLSTPALSGMVVHNGGVVQGQLAVQRAVTGAAAGYRHFGSPVQGATVAQLGSGGSPMTVNPAYNTAPNPGLVTPFPTVFGYDQTRLSAASATTSSFDYGWKSPGSMAEMLSPGLGWTAQLGGSQVVTFTGVTGSPVVGVTTLRNSGTANSGWHLLANPFLAPLNLSTLRPALQSGGLADAVYVFRPSGPYTGSYDQYVNGVGTGDLSTGQLAVAQGFFARNLAPGSTASVNFNLGMCATTYANPVFERQARRDLRPRLDLRLRQGAADDVVVFYAENGATTGSDARFDAWKVPTAQLLSVATVAGTERLSIQGLPELSGELVLPLEVLATQAGPATFEAARLDYFPAAVRVLLEDRATGRLHDLRGGAYTAPLTAGRHNGRFFVRLDAGRVLATGSERLAKELQLYPNPAAERAYLSLPATGTARIEVLNAVGQRVLAQEARASHGLATAELNTADLARGVYSVRVTTAEGTATRKLVLR
ncbi:kelch repeat-containing protein [Hymenobacter sp. B81]|uniref:kelch repeat-containing protein n=1 Tax=Hymenobacter sp. B81 TaxID=3344878 RepID=UPI0037DD22E0